MWYAHMCKMIIIIIIITTVAYLREPCCIPHRINPIRHHYRFAELNCHGVLFRPDLACDQVTDTVVKVLACFAEHPLNSLV